MDLGCLGFFFFLYSIAAPLRVLFLCPSERWTKERIIGLEIVADCCTDDTSKILLALSIIISKIRLRGASN